MLLSAVIALAATGCAAPPAIDERATGATASTAGENTSTIASADASSQGASTATSANASTALGAASSQTAPFLPPISDAASRVTKKPFGLFVKPGQSPVSPEKFTGYHTGVDFEAFESEADSDVPVSAMCAGTVRVVRRVGGYGGVVIQDCTYEDTPVTILYGHLDLASVGVRAGETLAIGDRVGLLGDGYSDETDGERKHLHLSVHEGSTIEYRGYVQTEGALDGWIDATTTWR